MQRKTNDKEIRRIKGEKNDDMEKSAVDHMRIQNEKLAKAIRWVKDDPSILEAVEKITANG